MAVCFWVILLVRMHCILMELLVRHESSALANTRQLLFLFCHTLTAITALKVIIPVFQDILQLQA